MTLERPAHPVGRLALLMMMLMGLALTTAHAVAQDTNAPATLIAEAQSVQPGQTFTVGIHYDIIDDPDTTWHVYWRNSESLNASPSVTWDLPEGYEVTGPRWPAPHRFTTYEKVQFGYEDQLTLLFDITVPQDAQPGNSVTLNATQTVDVCSDWGCNREESDVSLTLDITAQEPEPSTNARVIERAQASVPQPVDGWSFSAEHTDDGYALIIQAPSAEAAQALEGLYYYHDQNFAHDASNQGEPQIDGKTIRIALPDYTTDPTSFQDEPFERDEPLERLTGVLVAESGFGESGQSAMPVNVQVGGEPEEGAAAGDAGIGFVAYMLVLGGMLLGGLILNLMPCVFPVLSIKILGFVQLAGEQPVKVRRHGYAFGVGVLASFWVLVGVLLGIRAAAGDAISWGFQLQNPLFVLGMLLLVFMIGLNLIGAFEVGVGLSAKAGKASQNTKADGYGKSALTGVLATLIATPCTAPFMAGAVGAAITMPALLAFLAFTVLGIGMALPYVLLSCFPALLKYMPKPGPWMESFKQAMAFPMFATAGWLAWVYVGLTYDDMLVRLLIGLSIIAMGAWVYGRWSAPSRETRTRWIGRAVALVALVGGIAMVQQGAYAQKQAVEEAERAREAGEYVLEWVEFTPQTLEELRETGRPVLVDFTAKWCAVCQANKFSALRTDGAEELYAEHDVALVEADYTNSDPTIGRVLEDYKRAGVPLYLVFPADGGEPEILPNTLTPGILESAIERAAAGQTPPNDPPAATASSTP